MRIVSLLSAALLVACPGERHLDRDFEESQMSSSAPIEWSEDPELEGFRYELSEDSPEGAGGERLPQADATPLSEEATRGLLARAPALEPEGGEEQAFALRDGTEPPPRTGETIDVPFPPPDTSDAPAADTGPLRVLRQAPEGEVPMAPHLSVTFSQPMVPVTSQEQAAEVRPVTLEPMPEGTWRWIGSKTVLFEPSAYDRFPMATTYTVRVPAGTASETGGTLDEATEFTFTTPPPTLQSAWPTGGPHEREPLIFLSFDQRIDADAMAEHVVLRGAKVKRTWELAAASEAAIERDERVRRLVEQAEPERYVVLAPTSILPPATEFAIVVQEGAPSAEGPGTTGETQVRTFSTYEALRLTQQDCWQSGKECRPGGQWSIEFNNPLDEQAFDPDSIAIEPEPRRTHVFAQGRYLRIQPDVETHTTYEVTVPAGLTDRFGQTLGDAETLTFEVGGRDESFFGPGRDMLVLDPAAPPVFPVFTVNHEKMRVRVYRASPDDFAAVSTWFRERRYDGRQHGEPPLERLTDTEIEVADYAADERIETPIDLSPWLEGETGQLVVWVEPVPQAKKRWEQRHVLAWVQVTDIGLSALVDRDEILGWATRLSDGAPLGDVELTLHGGDGSTTGTTDAEGLARLGKLSSSDGPHLLVARRGDDVALLPDRQGWWNERGSWFKRPIDSSLVWYAFDDRHMYRPGETVSVKGWLRSFHRGPGGDVSLPDPAPREVTWVAQDANGNEMTRGTSAVSDTGGFHLSFELPDTPALGGATLRLGADVAASGDQHYHRFQIQEFRRPEFEVSASADPGPWVLGEHATVEVSARYFAGGALPGAPVRWDVRSSPATYQPRGGASSSSAPGPPGGASGGGRGSPASRRGRASPSRAAPTPPAATGWASTSWR